LQRLEIGEEKALTGIVGLHKRHVFLCCNGPGEWTFDAEAPESDRLPDLLATAIKARKPDLKERVSISTPSPFRSAWIIW
jgi:hypothetical protein